MGEFRGKIKMRTLDKKLTFIDFFAGIGGFRRGLELVGHKCIGFCEWDKFAAASYTSMHLITERQREHLANLPIKQRQKEILKDEYRNGEWYASDIRSVCGNDIPRADCWTFGAPCQDFSIAGKRAGLEGDRSSLIREIFRLLEEQEEQDRPEWLIYENVKGMLSSNKGLDYLSILSEMDRLGYDIEWQNINSKWFVPQNRERIYTVGHLRRFGRAKILPVTGTDGENSIQQLGHKEAERENPNAYRVYSPNGLPPCLGTMQGGGREPSIAFPCFVDMTIGKGVNLTENARTLCARYQKGMTNHEGTTSGIAIKIIGEVNSSQDGQVHDISGIAKCHSAGHNNSPKIAIPVIDVAHTEKNQNGKRVKENGAPMFTLTAQDRHGIAVAIDDTYGFGETRIYADCFPTLRSGRNGLKCGVGIIDPQGRNNKEVSPKDICPTLRSETHGNLPNVCVNIHETANYGNGIYVEMPEGFMVYAIWYEKEQCYITIRKLTPKECFRLQGWTDNYFQKAAFVNSDSQLYKQAGNGVTVDVVREIGKRMKKYNLE